MLDRRDAYVALEQGRAEHRLTHVLGIGPNLDRLVEVRANEHDARVGRRRTQHHQHLLARVQTHPRGADRIFEGALAKHANSEEAGTGGWGPGAREGSHHKRLGNRYRSTSSQAPIAGQNLASRLAVGKRAHAETQAGPNTRDWRTHLRCLAPAPSLRLPAYLIPQSACRRRNAGMSSKDGSSTFSPSPTALRCGGMCACASRCWRMYVGTCRSSKVGTRGPRPPAIAVMRRASAGECWLAATARPMPVATTVTRSSSRISGSITQPTTTFASSEAYCLTVSPTTLNSLVRRSGPAVTLISSP